MRKILTYSIIVLISILSVFLANYALVFPLTAKTVSSIAILMSLVYLLLALIHPKGWLQKEKHFLEMWTGPLLFSMHKIISPISIILLLWAQPFLLRWMNVDNKKDNEVVSILDKWEKSSFEVLLIALTFWGLDILREYTVWHELNFRILPTVLVVVLFFNWMIFRKNNSA
jgi:hypothetical protein